MTGRIQSWIDSGWLAPVPATDEEVSGLWKKALRLCTMRSTRS